MSSKDRAALVALFRSTGGNRWKNNDNWDTDADLSQWYGVEVNDDDRVVGLNLSETNVKGTVPEAIGALTELKALYLPENKLSGPIPDALRALKELTHLNLGYNKLTGSIPAWVGSLTKLQHLALAGNPMAGPIPGALGALTELGQLWLDHNKLTGPIPEALGALEKLTHLHLDGNRITGGPAKREGLDSWRARIRPKQETKPQTLIDGRREDDASSPPFSAPPV